MTIDNKLNFNHHINNVCKKANKRIEVLMRLKNLIPTEAKLQLYKAAILPHLTYCHLAWHFCKARTEESLSVYRKEGSGQSLRINILAMRNYWQKQIHHRCTTDDYRTLPSSCIRLSITCYHRDFAIVSY